jgi:hypothetical protein
LRNLLAGYVRKLPIDLRTYLLPFIYGLLGGLAAVAFQRALSTLFTIFWERPAQQMPPGNFALFSLATILAASIIAGLILTFVSRDAAGSGIPQVKVAFWRDFGFVPARVVIAKFFAGAISIGGGCSLGREGPTVHIAGALASNIAGWLGVAKQGRRPALLPGAAAGLAAAFNTPLSAITFVLEEIIEDLNNRGFLAEVLIASVTATFVCHIFLGDDPAFVIPSLGHFSGILYLLVIPAAGLSALAVSRAFCHTNFYSEIIERAGIELERHIPPRSLASLQSRPVSTLANFSPIFASSTNRDELEQLCAEHPYQQFPLVMEGQLVGMIDRNKILSSQSPKIPIEPAQAVPAHSTIRAAVTKMVENSMSLLVVTSIGENTPIGIVTLHDVLRLQHQLSDAASL